MTRKSSLELPSAEELREMIQKESPRLAARRDYLARHPQLFRTYKSVARDGDIVCDVIDQFEKMSFEATIAALHELTDAMNEWLSRNNENDTRIDDLYEELCRSAAPQPSDAIFVFGSPLNRRIEKAVELYHEGIAPIVIVTGSAPHWGHNQISEAERTARYAQEHGVPSEALFVENQSIATPDNVKRSVDLMDERGWHPGRVTIVTSEFNVRRAEMDMYKFPPWEVEVYAASPAPSEELSRQHWVETEQGRRTILNEYAKLIIESKIDQMLAGESYHN